MFTMNNLHLLFIFLIPLCLVLFFTPVVRIFAIKLGIISYPRQDRWHKNPTALMGGIAIYLACLISFAWFGLLSKNSLSLFMGASFLFVIGLVDDKIRITPYFKLFAQIIAACIPVLFNVFVGLPINNIFVIPLTIVWIIGVTNAFNLLDNIDGLACGIAAITAFMLFISLTITGERSLSLISLIICAASLGFLPYNFNRAKIFMGDSGSMFLGYSLAVISISGVSGKHISNVFTPILVPVLILGVPIFDTLFVMIGRSMIGRKIFEGGKDHTSHRLVMLGISQGKTVLLLYSISIIFGLIALLYAKTNLFIISIIAFCSFIILIYFGFFLYEVTSVDDKNKVTLKTQKKMQGKTVLNNFFMYKRQIVEVFLDFTAICIAYYAAYFLRFEDQLFFANFVFLKESLPWVIIIKLLVFFTLGLYRGVWRYIGISDFSTIFKVVSLGSFFSILFLTFVYRFQGYSRAVFFIDWLLLLSLILGSRFLFRLVGEFLLSMRKGFKNVLIFGAGDTGEMVIREIKKSKFMNYNVLGFIDDDPKKIGNRIHGILVLGDRLKIKKLVSELDIKEIFIAAPTLGNSGEIEIINICQECAVEYRTIKGVLD